MPLKPIRLRWRILCSLVVLIVAQIVLDLVHGDPIDGRELTKIIISSSIIGAFWESAEELLRRLVLRTKKSEPPAPPVTDTRE